MSQLIFAQAKSIRKKVKDAIKFNNDIDSDIPNETIAETVINQQRTEFREILRIAQLLHEDYKEIVSKETTNWYFVTIRPKPGVTWDDFKKQVCKYVKRSFMINYTLSFEQKSLVGSGEGFHVHIVCDTRHRSKTELLRDTQSTFNKFCEPNCIDVRTTRNPHDIIQNYLIEYKSDDEHKLSTKDGDQIWRNRMGLANIYENDLTYDDERPGAVIKSVTAPNTPILIEMS